MVLMKIPANGAGSLSSANLKTGNGSLTGQAQSYNLVCSSVDESWSHGHMVTWSRGEFEIISNHRIRKTVSLHRKLQ